jgi:hypothetical protein
MSGCMQLGRKGRCEGLEARDQGPEMSSRTNAGKHATLVLETQTGFLVPNPWSLAPKLTTPT